MAVVMLCSARIFSGDLHVPRLTVNVKQTCIQYWMALPEKGYQNLSEILSDSKPAPFIFSLLDVSVFVFL